MKLDIRFLCRLKNRFALASLFLFSLNVQAYLPNGRIQNYSFKEQSSQFNYEISGQVGYVSHLSGIFSAEKSTLKVYSNSTKSTFLEPIKIIHCDEVTFELNNAYIFCVQASKYLSIDLKTDKISN